MRSDLREIEKMLDELKSIIESDMKALDEYSNEVLQWLKAGGKIKEFEHEQEFNQLRLENQDDWFDYWCLRKRFKALCRKQKREERFDVVLTGHKTKQVRTPEGIKTFTTN